MSSGRTQLGYLTTAAYAVAASAVLCLATPASAQSLTPSQALSSSPAQTGVATATSETPTAAWYIVGNLGRGTPASSDSYSGFNDRQVLADEGRGGVGLGLTFSNGESDRSLSFTAPSTDIGGDTGDRFTFLVTGAYDWHTGTIVTPRFMAGVGVSYLDPDALATRVRQESGSSSDMTPAMQVGIGADVSVSSAFDLSAEYRASVRGAGDPGSNEQDPQLDQKFTIGAKLRF